jgi:hypothetical protein
MEASFLMVFGGEVHGRQGCDILRSFWRMRLTLGDQGHPRVRRFDFSWDSIILAPKGQKWRSRPAFAKATSGEPGLEPISSKTLTGSRFSLFELGALLFGSEEPKSASSSRDKSRERSRIQFSWDSGFGPKGPNGGADQPSPRLRLASGT